ncbi:penicillin-binding protein [Saccharomonospora sp. CUA-673]|uniref:serine hydrolase domain-containing protein n=1 Tax=Saccharomonospora sp. CUA-673 TaxID=1904969 RepID=UPI000959CE9B|nr:serine hydrolase domain-containing protein [Saccharomonospora sp. CUA-673]OLT38522.1 penicillin-binding protein [Saccharomonospora sp. CUA-673]
MAVEGMVAPGFEPVRDVFADIVGDARGGAAFAVVRDGEPVVDLWGGLADPLTGTPWRRDTLCVLFSGTKGIVATVAAALADRLDPTAPVRTYWPEFTADVTVGHVLSHTAGLPYVDGPHDLLDSAGCARLLATQKPLWEPGTRVAYHPLTYGYLAGELLRRVTGSSVGTLVQELVAPYGLDLHLGTPADCDPRMARLVRAPDYAISTFLTDPERRRIVERMYAGLLDSDSLMNSVAYRRAELAGGSGVGTARAMASLYDLVLRGCVVDDSALRRATGVWADGVDAINDRPVRFGLGYELGDSIGTYGPDRRGDRAFGHSGAGGGRHGAWPGAERGGVGGVGFSFLCNELRSEDRDSRAERLLTVLDEVLDR